MTLEERLTSHLHARSEASETESPSIDVIRRTAKRRSFRTRAVVGFCGLAALAGLGSVIPTGSEPNALVTANETDDTSDDTDSDPDSTTDQAAQEADPAPTPWWPPVNGPSFVIVTDDNGGFVGVEQPQQALVTSADGQEWKRQSEEWNPEAQTRYLTSLTRTGERYVGVSSMPSSRRSAGMQEPQVIVSRDLESWKTIELDVTAKTAAVNGLSFVTWINSVVAVDDQILVLMSSRPQVDYLALGLRESETCGDSLVGGVYSASLCNGESIEIASAETTASLGLSDPQRAFVSEAGQPFVEVPAPPLDGWTQLFELDGEFGVMTIDGGSVMRSSNGIEWTEAFSVSERTDPRFIWLIAGNDSGALAVGTPGTPILDPFSDEQQEPEDAGVPVNLISRLFTDSGVVESQIPIAVAPDNEFFAPPQLVSGPAGWAVHVSTATPADLPGMGDIPGWSATIDELFVGQEPGTGVIRVRSHEDESIGYSYGDTHGVFGSNARLPETVRRGFFGEYRLLVPGTTDVLVEVPGNDVRESLHRDSPAARETIRRLDNQTFAQDGWRVTGNPVTGPLTVTRPDGTSVTYTDGFAFTNADASDGVESDLFLRRDQRESRQTFVRFYGDDGAVELEVSTDDFYAQMYGDETWPPPSPEPTENDEEAEEEPEVDSWLAFSSDGVTWEVIWEAPSEGFAHIAVGDDEVVIIGQSPKPIRVPLGE